RTFIALSVAMLLIVVPAASAAGQSLQLNGPSDATVGEPVTFVGALLTSSGKGVPNQPITLYVDGARGGTARTDAAGSYHLDLRLTAGFHEVTAQAPAAHATVYVTVCGVEVCAL
ncbi:MAG TPA: hypothetical protein VGR28_05010, partial [Candidatus Thermoplasmatota archaeon]|nr:hypothetical protein [Candidatus Thermoplasmatota archaeon]